jgi:pyruvate,water dikinase
MAAPWTLSGVRMALDGELYIFASPPETVKSRWEGRALQARTLPAPCRRRAIGQKIGTGPVRIVHNISEMDGPAWRCVGHRYDRSQPGARMSVMLIVTNRVGVLCHAAIIARELGILRSYYCGNAN